jgi:hypothetical protein
VPHPPFQLPSCLSPRRPRPPPQALISPEARAAWERYSLMLKEAGGLEGGGGGGGGGGKGGGREGRPGAAKRRRVAAVPAPEAAGGDERSSEGEPGGSGEGCGGGSPPPRQPRRLGELYDTVGAVVVGPRGRVAAGVSSGGLALKAEGRVGEAAVFGAGCWADDPGGGSGGGGDAPGW